MTRRQRITAREPRGQRQGSQAGYSLIELMISSAIMLTVTGAIFGLMNPAQGQSQAQNEVADLQQRMRVASDSIFKELIMAAAGVYHGAVTGSLLNYFAPVVPRRAGDGPTVFRDDAIMVTYVPNTNSQTAISSGLPAGATELTVDAQPNCPTGKALCGFEAGMVVLVFDTAGHFDTFEISAVAAGTGTIQHQGAAPNHAFDAGASVTQGTRTGFYRDAATQQLRKHNGWLIDTPLADNVVELTFSYFGDPNPPLAPKKAGEANCLYDAAGNSLGLPVLPLSDGSLSALTPAILTDGPFCGDGANQYDADLLRIRKIRATLRMQVASEALRGLDATLWKRPGTSQGGARSVPDYIVTFEVTPRNMNLAR